MNDPLQMMNAESTAAQIVALLAEALDIPAQRIGMLTRLRQDLKLDGPVAEEVIALFALTFEVDTGPFRVNDYFAATPGGAGNGFFAPLLWMFGNAKPLKTLTVKDLVLAAENGTLA